MTSTTPAPEIFSQLRDRGCICSDDVVSTKDGFFALLPSLCDILAKKDILDFPDSAGQILACDRFFDDWHLFAVVREGCCAYGLFKLREQEYDAQDGSAADGDTPGVTVSFISFRTELLLLCLDAPTGENRSLLNKEINRVVAHSRQRHHSLLKSYFLDPASEGSYLIAALYVRHIASFAEDGSIPLPEHYLSILQQSISYKHSAKLNRLPRFLSELNQAAGREIVDRQRLYFADPAAPSKWECAAVLATHTGNTSIYSFAAEVEYHAKFLVPLARLRIPFFGRSIYASAIRADMTIDDTEFEGPAPFYRDDSAIVRRQRRLHPQADGFSFLFPG